MWRPSSAASFRQAQGKSSNLDPMLIAPPSELTQICRRMGGADPALAIQDVAPGLDRPRIDHHAGAHWAGLK